MKPLLCLSAFAGLALLCAPAPAAAAVTPPERFFAQPPGTDYFLADYTAYEAYLKRIASESDRIRLVDFGKTEEGRSQWLAIVSSPANLARLDHYRGIAEKLARARIPEAEARALAAEGKAVVWIDAGLHATEVITSQGQIQVLYRMLTDRDPETARILDDTIVLFAHDNPDGMEMVSDWYMRHADPKKREFATLPRLYQKYAGHDNNRDSYTVHLKETENVNRMLFRTWYPQIVYNQHQTGPEGMVVFLPPFRDPFNFNYDPLIVTSIQEIGSAMHSRLIAEGKPGSGMRSAYPYSMWHNGMERSVAYFHNSIGLLSEIIGHPTPSEIPLVPSTQLPRADEPMPVAPQKWHLQQSLDYQWSMNRAVMDYASRNRERLLFNIWRMGANSIARGSRDSWTITPSKVARLEASPGIAGARGAKKVDPALYRTVLQDPDQRDPRGYVLPSDQPDFPNAVAFANMLIKTGVEVERATRPFTLGAKRYPGGSIIIRTAQAYRPHVLDLFEPQDHPNDVEYPGGPPKPPYDVAGYTLALQMGVQFDRVLHGFEGPFEPIPDVIRVPAGRIVGGGGAGWLIDHSANASFVLTNRLLKAGIRPSWLPTATRQSGRVLQPGAIWVPATPQARIIVEQGTRELGIDAYASARAPTGPPILLKPSRVGLVDRWGGLMPSGWTRFILERHEFPYELVFPQRLAAGDLARDFDVLIFPDGAITPPRGGPWPGGGTSPQPEAEDTPVNLRHMLGDLADGDAARVLGDFAKSGGTILAVGSSTRLGPLLGAPLDLALVAKAADGSLKALDTKSFYVPGSLLRAQVDNRHPLAFGMPSEVDMFFNRAQTFRPVAGASGVANVSWFGAGKLLRSGWAVGEERLQRTSAVSAVELGRGMLVLMGPEVTQRAQPSATFKFLFNGILYGPADKASAPR